jgi:hypothetical protein
MIPKHFFLQPSSVAHKQYEALRMYFIDNKTAKETALQFGYTYRAFTSILSDFKSILAQGNPGEFFFQIRSKGRRVKDEKPATKDIIIDLRKKFYSVADIKVFLDAKALTVSEKSIFLTLKKEGFARLPRRPNSIKKHLEEVHIPADKSVRLSFKNEDFKSNSAGLLCFLPYFNKYGIDKLIEQSSYPQTKSIKRLNSIMSFLGLKLSDIRRYSADDLWCMDRGMGLFAGLNVLPKGAWFTSYSSRITSDMNLNFLKSLHKKWLELGLLSDTINMDFTTVPYWGENLHLENNWSGKRGKALPSMLAVLAHDPDSGLIDYGDTKVMHKDESQVVLEFLDFYKNGDTESKDLKYLVFDSKFTNYQNLNKIDNKGIKFITIRRRGKNLVTKIEHLSKENWKIVRVECAGNKHRSLHVSDQKVLLKGYGKEIRQVCITGHGKIKPAVIITNDFDLHVDQIVRKYAKRWLVEKTISEQIEFFHLNHVSSSMVIKVDFDLTMSILAHNMYRLLAMDLERYSHMTANSIYEKFLLNSADVAIDNESIIVKLKKKKNLPLILEKMNQFSQVNYPAFKNKKIIFEGATYS